MSKTRIKFCGMTRLEDVRLAVALEVDFIGLIFAQRSKRRLDVAQAQTLRAAVLGPTAAVALLMNQAEAEVAHIAAALQPDYLQFHGDEDDAFCAHFGLPFFKAIAMRGDVDPLLEMERFPSAYGFVLDGHGVGEAGGSGQRFDWKRLPTQAARPILLAGGVGPENVGEAIATAHPWGVDAASGIESAPGIKDARAMRQFVAAARQDQVR